MKRRKKKIHIHRRAHTKQITQCVAPVLYAQWRFGHTLRSWGYTHIGLRGEDQTKNKTYTTTRDVRMENKKKVCIFFILNSFRSFYSNLFFSPHSIPVNDVSLAPLFFIQAIISTIFVDKTEPLTHCKFTWVSTQKRKYLELLLWRKLQRVMKLKLSKECIFLYPSHFFSHNCFGAYFYGYCVCAIWRCYTSSYWFIVMRCVAKKY